MTKKNHSYPAHRIFFLLAVFIVLCYSNTFNASWQFDDFRNIVNNAPLHLDTLQPETILETFYAYPGTDGQLYRPVACLSFALNWFFGQDDTFGYHLVNMLVHILTAFFLFKTTFLLLRSPFLKKYTEQDILFIALLSALLWAINPIQTQAVTYIVQRMASMCAMFFVFALYSYVRARQAEATAERIKRLLLGGLFFLLALGTKENAVTLIPTLLLTELLFFKRTDRFSRAAFMVLIGANILFFLAAFYYFYARFLQSNTLLQALTAPGTSRPFSLLERLLTQAPILLFYLSLLLFPSPARLSLEHSFPLSTSLIQPWTTLLALLCIIALLVFAVVKRRKMPLLSFAILFFFINHLVESTILPLELIFEHRNYLPSFFLFLPLAAGILWVIHSTKASSRLFHSALLLVIPLLLIALGFGTYTRNQVWATEASLWLDALAKAPDNGRPYANMGRIFGMEMEKNPENLRTASLLYHKALERQIIHSSQKPVWLYDLGTVYARYNQLDHALPYYNQSLEVKPTANLARRELAQILTFQGNFDQALEHINTIITQGGPYEHVFNLKTLLLLWLDRPDEAVESSHIATLLSSDKERYLYLNGVALTRAGHVERGASVLKKALMHWYWPNEQFTSRKQILYSLVENRILAGDSIGAQDYIQQLLADQSITLQQDMEQLGNDYSAVPINTHLIAPAIFAAVRDSVSKLEQPSSVNSHASKQQDDQQNN